jgi:hypothetical protein
METPQPEQRQVSAYEYAIFESKNLLSPIKEKSIVPEAVLIAGSIMLLGAVVGEGLRMLNGTLTTHNEILVVTNKKLDELGEDAISRKIERREAKHRQ